MKRLDDIVNNDAFGGLLLCLAGLLALILANSPAQTVYDSLLNSQLIVQLGLFKLEKPLVLWINDGLMAIFFLLVGLEIKRELLTGKLKDMAVVVMPGVGAVCGLLVPALIYIIIARHNPLALHGWAIPVATDIAFSLAALSLLGSRVPVSLKIFLTALAIIDDIGAIIIIALFYTRQLSTTSLSMAGICIFFLLSLNAGGVKKVAPYLLVGFLLWLSVLESGVHATLAGIILAFTIPLKGDSHEKPSPLRTLEHALLPWVTLFVLPAFAFANSGFPLSGVTRDVMLHPATLGIIFGLFVGKQTGIFGSCWLLAKLGWGKLPEDISWPQLYGISVLCGVGFTMSLFIGSMAFQQQTASYSIIVRLGVLIGSVSSAILGLSVLLFFSKTPPRR